MRNHQGARAAMAAIALFVLAPAIAPAILAAEDADARARRLQLGLVVGSEGPPALPSGSEGEAGAVLTVRLRADWGAIEIERGAYDWSRLEPTVALLRDGRARVVLALGGTNPLYLPDGGVPAPTAGESLQGWSAFVRSAVRTFAGRVSVFELGDDPSASYEPATYAFVLKSAALAARAEARASGAAILIAQGAVPVSRLDWQETLYAQDVAPYVDIVPVAMPARPGAAAALAGFLGAAAAHPPAPALWAYVAPEGAAPAFAACAGAVEALAASAETALAFAALDPDAASKEAAWLAGVSAKLGPDFAPAPSGGLELRTPEGETGAFRVVGRFFHQKDFRTLVVYDAPLAGAPQDAQARLVLDTVDVKEPRIVDPLSGADLKTGPADVPGVAKRALRVLRRDHPMLALWERASQALPGLETETENLEVEGTRGLTAEEIIARHREVQKVQDDRLDRWMARGRVDFHFKLAQGGATVDVAIESNYFWERGGALEWEQTDYWINGNKVTWKNIPELPLIQPEKVITLPLDLTLDKAYAYRLVGEDDVAKRPAYVLAFEPVDENTTRSLYRGRVWIDKETFARLKASVLQTNLEPPVLSNEETDLYQPVTGPDGETYWMLARIDGQQLWTAAGRNFVVRRELTFPGIEINPPAPGFAAARRAAFASTNQVLRDTDKGFRYLERQDDGTRTVKETLSTHQLFALAGLAKDDSQSGVLPLAGVSWFDYKFLGKDLQASVFFAGVVAFANVADPALGGTRLDLAVEGAAVAIKSQDKVFDAGDEVVAQRVRQRTQFGSVRLGIPLGNFVKATVIGSAAYRQFDDDADARKALADANAASGTQLGFVLPADHTVLATGLEVEFNRKGYTLRGAGFASRRSEWRPWGLYDEGTQTFVSGEYDAAQESFLDWQLTAFKEWYLPKFQKIRAEVNWLDGADLDRFSRYKFSLFGQDRLNGFAGTGVRFDSGAIARLGYAFNLFGAIRLDAALERARVKDATRDDRWRSFTGAGVSGNVIGPWKTVVQFSYGRAIQAELPGLKGKQEFLLVILKLF